MILRLLRWLRFLVSSGLALLSWVLAFYVSRTVGEFLVVGLALVVAHLSLYRLIVPAQARPRRRRARGRAW